MVYKAEQQPLSFRWTYYHRRVSLHRHIGTLRHPLILSACPNNCALPKRVLRESLTRGIVYCLTSFLIHGIPTTGVHKRAIWILECHPATDHKQPHSQPTRCRSLQASDMKFRNKIISKAFKLRWSVCSFRRNYNLSRLRIRHAHRISYR